MQETEISKRILIVKWFLVVALLPLSVVIVGSVPAIVATTGKIVPQSFIESAMLTVMFFAPLAAIFLMMPLVKLLDRSVLLWGLGVVLLPLGMFIMGGWLLYLMSRRTPSEASAVSGGL